MKKNKSIEPQPGPGEQSVLPGVKGAQCPFCGFLAKGNQGLTGHMRLKHSMGKDYQGDLGRQIVEMRQDITRIENNQSVLKDGVNLQVLKAKVISERLDQLSRHCGDKFDLILAVLQDLTGTLTKVIGNGAGPDQP